MRLVFFVIFLFFNICCTTLNEKVLSLICLGLLLCSFFDFENHAFLSLSLKALATGLPIANGLGMLAILNLARYLNLVKGDVTRNLKFGYSCGHWPWMNVRCQ